MADIIRTEVKDNKPHIEHKDIHQQLKKEVVPTDLEDKKKAAKARLNAHTIGADMKREISMDIKNTLFENFEFIEESCGSGAPTFEFFDTPQKQVVSEGVLDNGIEMPAVEYPIIGKATGVFAPIGVMSRNNRIYDADHYDYLLGNQQLVDRITHRGMLGTIGHHNKKVDDQDLADGKVSHIVSDLHIQEEEDGTRNLYGTLEILDTPAGHLLKTYYDSGIPLFVSSRGGGNLLSVPHESYKRVDKTKYFLETFDIVKNPGFLQAKPVYEKVTEGVEEVSEDQNICEVSDKTVEKDLDKRGDQMVQSLFKKGGTETEPYQKAKALADKRAERQGKEIVQDNETGEHKHVDKIDKLAEALTNFVNILAEKKEDKPEDDEAKEAKEKKEAKEAKEAKEKAEAKIDETVEDKEDEEKLAPTEEDEKKEEKKPEDEKKDDAEDAVAETVSEEDNADELHGKFRRYYDKLVDKTIKGHPDKEQLKIGTDADAKSMALAAQKFEQEKKEAEKALAKEYKARHKNDKKAPEAEVIQTNLFKTNEESEYEKNMKIADKAIKENVLDAIDKYGNPDKRDYLRHRALSNHDNEESLAQLKEHPDKRDWGENNEVQDKRYETKNTKGELATKKRRYNALNQAKKAIEEAENIIAKLEMPIAPVQTEDEAKKAQDEKENKEELPITFNHQDLARALRADYKFIKGENK